MAADEAGLTTVLSETLGFCAFVALPLYFAGRILYPMRRAATRLSAAGGAQPSAAGGAQPGARSSSVLPRRLFAASFSLSLCLLVLVLLDVSGALSPPARRTLWRACMLSLLGLLVLGLPFATLFLLLRRATGVSAAAAAPLALLLTLAWLYTFYRVGDPFPVDSAELTATSSGAIDCDRLVWTLINTGPSTPSHRPTTQWAGTSE